jgi:hypothetical protein
MQIAKSAMKAIEPTRKRLAIYPNRLGRCPRSAITGVMSHWAQLEIAQEPSPQLVHEVWLKERHESGWKSAVKNETKKEYPGIVPYEEPPEMEKLKDYIFSGIVKTFFASQPVR